MANDADPLPATGALTIQGDIASQLVAGADRFLLKEIASSVEKRSQFWERDFSSFDAYNKSIELNRQRFAKIIGVRDSRPAFDGPELFGTTTRPALIAKGHGFDVFTIRWPAFGDVHGEGLLLVPHCEKPIANVVALPDCDQTPEQLIGLSPGIATESQYARYLAENGCRVVIPVLINRREKLGRLTNREWIYRAAYELGRGLIGYEVQKVLACIDWFEKEPGDRGKIGVVGFGEGALLGLYAGALDPRIDAICVSGYFDRRNDLWQEPLDRNVFGLLEQFGDAELASMIAPRTLIIEAAATAEVTIAGGRGAPARILTPELESVRGELERARQLTVGLKLNNWPHLVISGDDGRGPFGTPQAISALLARLAPGTTPVSASGVIETIGAIDQDARHARQLHELERHNQTLLQQSQYVRQKFFWDKLNYESLVTYDKSIEPFRKYFYEEVIGRFELPLLPPNVRTRQIEESDRWTRYEVVMDVFPDVIAYGLLTLPKDIKAGEKRPVVVCQHGLEHRPQDTIGEKNIEFYQAFTTKLAEEGFITFAPQNVYLFEDRFRTLQRKANPIKKTLFSIIVPQHAQIVGWLQTLKQVDPARIAFYGLSYGGKTAMRVPPLVDGYCLSICSGDFNEWVDKNASTLNPHSYLFGEEYEMFEFDLGSTFNYAEMAALIAPRPFMVERGHFDGVASDETVGWEYAKVRHLYAARLHIPERTEIEWFAGPHRINGRGTFRFLKEHLK
ncbi:MAG: hypothetical protein IT427_12115 [Pirellulales bacterium]|nr:hypothetical protein [Pirellulales bacterium]